jgi:hypothetical protein
LRDGVGLQGLVELPLHDSIKRRHPVVVVVIVGVLVVVVVVVVVIITFGVGGGD